ncbi:MAG: excinuclease ABC subunit A [Candidatus Moranbacteria bacterium GW2011_GWC1_45_18]|nr:MAG: UvrABC system protein A [Candidatus Moranbacteria bacterium GW2011_GWC2_40_12]KKT99313.1 MAG: excinuclease ABC subunit A [Candidatus Moranbacteria bacterium GW2011_GWC1_45_18]OGI36737.1 MAG: excinuclease ABC subunit A [Candidatus Moranbacteria bacterium RIFOXYC1_FULL_44_8]OGI40672.1 MAG: excinuclease ABC subunit A [Candidatus Moranbacteria bacterium RIFOXYB1_FULL_44_23]HBB36406.1 excinuclease ABC subunit UvrA [Candidatus Moranbacteria bacterium]
MDKIIIRGAREHNLKNINLELPRGKFIVFTGISGSGKSTLAFDTIFAEGQRRYLESLSSYARQFLGQMEKPDVDSIEGLSPAISIDQKASSHNPRSTVGTVTEIHDYLRLLYAKIGIPHCPVCKKVISKLSIDEIVDRILEAGTGSKIEILAPVVRERKGEYSTLLGEMFKRGFSEAIVDSQRIDLTEKAKLGLILARYKKHSIDVKIDEVEVNDKNLSRIFESVESALKLSQGLVKMKTKSILAKVRPFPSSSRALGIPQGQTLPNSSKLNPEEIIFNQNMACPEHEEAVFPEIEPRLFSFNSPQGACLECEGLGTKKEIDPNLVIPDKTRTITEGAIMPWSYKPNNYQGSILRAVTNYYRIPDNVRFRDLGEKQQNILLFGDEEPDDIEVRLKTKTGAIWKFNVEWNGILGFMRDRYFKTESESVRQDIEKYMSRSKCPACKGSRYKPEALLITVGGKNISEISSVSVADTLKFFEGIKLSEREKIIADKILKEVKNRLKFLDDVGLGYLTLARSANTLAGGETQRIRLASQIGSQLVGVLYILDEPSVGLHARDNAKLLETLLKLRDIGNTVIVIEHDEETIRSADHLVDIGPGAGRLGGEIVAEGSVKDIEKEKKSITGKYLRGELEIEIPKFRRPVKNKKWLTVKGATEHNLKNISVEFPLKTLTCVTGVSGSGKSTLVEDILGKGLSAKIMRSLERPGRHKEILGTQYVDKVIHIDQSPIGRTPRSNPATYVGFFTLIRELFAMTKDAKRHGYGPGRFSFNVNGGRCDNCRGEGFLKVEMQFMPDVFLPCDVCRGKRYNRETLEVKYKGKNIADVLAMTVSEGRNFFENFPRIYDPLKVLEEVGLGYINLGQAATTLSGGEAQRIKLASELSRRMTGNTLYILDEPTTGLHFDDVKKLLHVLHRLVEAGNTVIVIEHNMDVIKTADWIIDLGPEGGDNGGRVVVTGPPEEVVKYHKESYTGKFLREVLK